MGKLLANVLDNIDNISGKKLKERLAEGKEDALLSKELATIFTKPSKVLYLKVCNSCLKCSKSSNIATVSTTLIILHSKALT